MDQSLNNGNSSGIPSPSSPSSSTLAALAKPLFLLVLSVVLTISVVMSIFTPLTLLMALLLFGRANGIGILSIGLAIMFVLGKKFFDGPMLLISYLTSSVLALILFEIVLRNIPPIRAIIVSGFALSGVATLVLAVASFSLPNGPQKFLSNQIENVADKIKKNQISLIGQNSEDSKAVMEKLSKSDELAKEIIQTIPFTVFISIFFSIWLNLGMAIRFQHLYKDKVGYSHTVKDFLHFKTPDYLIWPMIAILLLLVLGPYLWKDNATVVGKNLAYCFGVFYFFQGFGILVDILTVLKIEGTFRSLLIILTVITNYWILALIGLFDMWVDFRKLIRKKLERGDTK